MRVSLHPPLATAALTCRALCHTRLRHGPPAPWGKVLHVVSFYFQIYWWCWDGQAPRKRRLRCNTKQCSLVSCGFSLWHPPSFRDVATPTRHPRENLPGETSSHPIPQSTQIYTQIHISVCVRVYIYRYKTEQKPQSGKTHSGSNPNASHRFCLPCIAARGTQALLIMGGTACRFTLALKGKSDL